MIGDPKVVPMPGVQLQSVEGLTVDRTIADRVDRYTKIVIIGTTPDGVVEVNSPNTCEETLWMIERAKKIIME